MRPLPLVLVVLALSACASERITRPAAPAAPAHRIVAPATDVVYYLDGKEIPAKLVEGMDTNSIHSVEVLKGESARRVLGDRAAYSVVLITSKATASPR